MSVTCDGEVSERFKELVLKTSDSQEPWVRIPPSPPADPNKIAPVPLTLEMYSRGRRGAPAKGVGRETVARVQIPPSPPNLRSAFCDRRFFLSYNCCKKRETDTPDACLSLFLLFSYMKVDHL